MPQGYAVPSIDSLSKSKAFSWEDAKCDFCGADASMYEGAYFCKGCFSAAYSSD